MDLLLNISFISVLEERCKIYRGPWLLFYKQDHFTLPAGGGPGCVRGAVSSSNIQAVTSSAVTSARPAKIEIKINEALEGFLGILAKNLEGYGIFL